MLPPELSLRAPTDVPARDLRLPDDYDLTFEGFSAEAFALLARLREAPHIEQYRKEKPGVRLHLKEPFKRYRDDLVVNWVLPNRLDFETEKNVFSRLLKNDFGAGGCHHHLWMSFYRPGRRRLSDFQLTHSIDPDGFTVGLYVGDHARALLKQARARIAEAPDRFLEAVNPLLGREGWRFYYYRGSGEGRRRVLHTEPLDELANDLLKARGVWIRRVFHRRDVLRWSGRLVVHALEAVRDVWPAYRLLARP